MTFVNVPEYKDVFDGNAPGILDLIQDIPTEVIVSITSVLNAELHLNSIGNSVQKKLLNLFIRRQTPKIKKDILLKLSFHSINKPIDEITIFSIHTNLEFLHFCLNNPNFTDNAEDINPEKDLNLFKAYLLITTELNNNFKFDRDCNSINDSFRKFTWPLMIGQFQFNQPQNYFLSIVKAKCFFDVLEFDTNYSDYVINYINRFGKQNSLSYIWNFVNILKQTNQSKESENFSPFYIKPDNLSLQLFDEISLDIENYHLHSSGLRDNFKLLKSKPFVKMENNTYLILNWNFVAGKLFDGMLFDFHKLSGIKKEKKFEEFISFKTFVSEKSIEKYLFRKLVKSCFKSKYSKIQFDKEGLQGHPDAYVRTGNKIFLFELKDAYFPSRVIDSQDYDKIKEEIDKKYNNNKKGTGQIIKQMQSLRIRPFEEHSYEELRLKPKNFIIYPILIYTDANFGINGIDQYLEEEFSEKVKKVNLNNDFKKIKRLSFINLDFLIENLDQLQNSKLSLDNLVDNSEREVIKRLKRYNRTKRPEDLMPLNENFEFLSLNILERSNSNEDYVKILFESLNLGRGI